MAGCPGFRRRRNLLGGDVTDDGDEAFLCMSEMEALEVVLEDASTVVLMETEGLELSDGCDANNLWFIVYTV